MLRIVPWLPPVFEDRAEAGRVLAASVAEAPPHEPIVVAVARGGVAVAVEVARALAAPPRRSRLGSITSRCRSSGGTQSSWTTASSPA